MEFPAGPLPRTCTTLLLAAAVMAVLPRSATAAQDTLRTLAVLVDYSDAPGTLTVAKADSLFNHPGYTGVPINIRDYWLEVSRGKVLVHTKVVGTFRAPKTAAAYQALGWQDGVAMSAEALDWVVRTQPTFDWNSLSKTKDGRLVGVSMVSSTKVPASGATHYLGDRFTAPNGVKAGSLVYGQMGMFTFNHEYGHALFKWPDLYSITGGRGLGDWELMSGSNQVMGIPNAKLQADAGWMQLQDVAGEATLTLEENGTLAYRFRNPRVPQEYFLIEARNDQRPTTRRPAFGRGLLIFHVDERVRGNGNYNVDGERMTLENHYYMSLEQADGKFDLEAGRSSGDIGDVYVPGKAFSDATLPHAKWWDGTPSAFALDAIQLLAGNRISFRIRAPGTAWVLARPRRPDAGGIRLGDFHSLDGRKAAPGNPPPGPLLLR